MKTFIFVRGIDTPFKRMVVDRLMESLNPNPNGVTAIKLSLSDYGKLNDKASRKAANSSCKKLMRRLLGGSHYEQFIVIDNESLLPVHWQSYYSMAEGISVNTVGIGIDVISPDKFLTEAQVQKKNLQEQNMPVFKVSMYKYYDVKSDEDIDGILVELEKLKKPAN